MSTVNLTNEPIKRRPLWRRILRWTVRTVIVLIIGFLVWHYVNLYFAKRELQQTIAELDKTDPKWRWEDLMAEWPDVPDAENGALVVLRAHEKLPAKWPDYSFEYKMEEIAPVLRHPRPFLCRIEHDHQELSNALDQANLMARYTHGKYPRSKLTKDVFSTPRPHADRARRLEQLLRHEMWIALDKRQVVDATGFLQAIFNTARTLGKEPDAIVQLVRLAIASNTVTSLERLVANSNHSAIALPTFSKLLYDESRHEYFQHMIEGERASMHIMYENLAAGKFSLAQFSWPRRDVTLIDEFKQFLSGPTIARSHDVFLRYTTEMAKAARLPISERYVKLAQLGEQFEKQSHAGTIPELACHTSSLFPCAPADRRVRTILQCARAGVAAELFRLKNNRWPESLDEMIDAKLLNGPPIDHYTAKPVKMRRTKDGLVFYSPGPDGKYKGDALDDPYHPKLDNLAVGVRLEFRLWDIDKRRQPAPKIRDIEIER